MAAALSSDRGPLFKVVLLGEANVGKTSLFYRLKENTFFHDRRNTIGIDSCSKFVKSGNRQVTLSVWDTAGVERFRTVTKNYYRGAHACVMMFSVDDHGSLQYLLHWLRDAEEYCPDALKILVANKIDLDAEVQPESMELFASSHECNLIVKISAKTGEGIDEACVKISQELLKENKEIESHNENTVADGVVGVGKTPEPTLQQWRSGCCS